VSGRISSINAASRTFQVSSTTVAVPAAANLTSAANHIEFKDLRIDLEVHVHGTMNGAVVTAEQVEVEDHLPDPEPGDQGETEILGSIVSIDGSCPGLSMNVGATPVKTSDATTFLKAACSQLRSGMTVEVKGTMQGGALIAARVQMDDDGALGPEPEPEPEPEPGEQETEFKGTAALLGGSCPVLSLNVAGRNVVSSAATEFKGGSCADVKSGVTLEVKGMAARDGSVTASRLKIDK
jgi:phage baseplate assembly protein gpV